MGHEGGFPSYNATVNHYPEARVTLVVLSNTGGAAVRLEQRIAALVLGGDAE